MSARKALREDEAAEPSVEREVIGEGPSAIWRIRSFAAARTVLRARTCTSQAGFTAERIPRGVFRRHPILISDGPAHDAQRRDLARFFAPAVVADRYGDFIAERAEAAVEHVVRQGRCRLDEVALHFAVEVTAEVVGLTESSVAGMSRRLEGFFTQPPVDLATPNWGRTRLQWLQAAINGLVPIGRFYLADVRPAVRARRRGRGGSRAGGDVLTHLIESGHSTSDILVECVTYGTAGMVTTREFISMACWHLLSDPDLGAEYSRAEQPRRLEILKEIIRLEPVVGHLYRRARDEVEIADGGSTHTIARGDLIDVCVRETNTDPAAFDPTESGRDDTESGGDGSDPHSLCPARLTADGVPAVGMSFSDGAHSCPGQPLALLETDALLHRLLAHRPRILAHRPRILNEPTIGWDSVIAGYRIRGLELAFDHGHGTERGEPDYGEPDYGQPAGHEEPT
ncbi:MULTISPECIES: cytochrome P450 [unclassified Brevibacterium]|uniref:cytochrome P450 n=1 Tax=unclassified Brevibacterium TaxID=2614124 RepID=UPI001E5C77B6|nr:MULTISPECIES: cytochrome P450 [unclassified Brevibacterium]MDK8434571.1 cytochrome P450 [Brevibacterium sp. H-BE7]